MSTCSGATRFPGNDWTPGWRGKAWATWRLRLCRPSWSRWWEGKSSIYHYIDQMYTDWVHTLVQHRNDFLPKSQKRRRRRQNQSQNLFCGKKALSFIVLMKNVFELMNSLLISPWTLWLAAVQNQCKLEYSGFWAHWRNHFDWLDILLQQVETSR